MSVRKYTRKEIAENNSKSELIFVINNIVYNVHEFLDEHPGGHEVLVKMRGQDASENFNDVGHSLDAKELMQKYVVGEVVDEEKYEIKEKKVEFVESPPVNDGAVNNVVTSWMFPLIIGVLISTIYWYFFN